MALALEHKFHLILKWHTFMKQKHVKARLKSLHLTEDGTENTIH